LEFSVFFYQKYPKTKAGTKAMANGTQGPSSDQTDLIQKLSAELVAAREEIHKMREQNQGLMEDQMTVDNVQLARQLDDEKKQLQVEKIISKRA